MPTRYYKKLRDRKAAYCKSGAELRRAEAAEVDSSLSSCLGVAGIVFAGGGLSAYAVVTFRSVISKIVSYSLAAVLLLAVSAFLWHLF